MMTRRPGPFPFKKLKKRPPRIQPGQDVRFGHQGKLALERQHASTRNHAGQQFVDHLPAAEVVHGGHADSDRRRELVRCGL